MRSRHSGAAWGSLLVGAVSVAVLPIAIYITRFSDSYDLLHSGFAIPIAGALGVVALALARRSRRLAGVSLTEDRSNRVAQVGRVLGLVGLCLAASALVALGVYGLLEYVGSRD